MYTAVSVADPDLDPQLSLSSTFVGILGRTQPAYSLDLVALLHLLIVILLHLLVVILHHLPVVVLLHLLMSSYISSLSSSSS
jgi:hypothetical protein